MLNSKKEVKMKRKGQAAMEFLMTYGWAILAAIIVIGVLAFYFRPTGLGAGASRLNQPFYLVDSNVQTTAINLRVRNDGDGIANVNNITVTSGSNDCSTATLGGSSLPQDIPIGGTADVVITGACLPSSAGGSFQGNVVIDYTIDGGLSQRGTGVIAGEVQ